MLKLDPKNTELLKQKQDVLNQSITTTEEKLKQLQKIKEEADKKMADGTQIDEANYRSLQREIINTQNKLSNLKNEASNWTKASEQITKWGNSLESIGQKIDSLGNKLTTRLTLPIAGIVATGIKYNAEIEQMTTAYETFLGSAEEADKVVTNIKNNAAKTPFDASSLIKANQMLISTGENADASQKTIMALGEAITATGGGNDELTRMASNLQQIRNAGKATSMDIRQFAYAGIDVYGLLADYLGKTTQEIKNMEISYEDLSGALQRASQEGGKYYGAMDKASKTLTGQTKQLKAQFKDMTGQLAQSLMPVAKKLVEKASDLIKKFDSLSDSEKENIVKIGLLVAAAGPLLKVLGTITSTAGNVAKGIGTVTKAIGLAKNGIGDATGTAANLAKVFQGLSSPLGIAAVGITAAVGIIIAEIEKAEKQTREKFSKMGESANDFYDSIKSAEGYLDIFNTTLFATSQEQEELKEQMDEIQAGITKICKTASDERRDYTAQEIQQLDEYFTKLRELKDREIQIEQQIAGAITQQAKTNAETFQGSLDEYKVQSQEWIATAQQQADKTIKIINDGTIEEIALLNQRYGKEATMQNEAYAKEYNTIMEQKQKKIDSANNEVAEILSIYTKEYADRADQDGDFYEHIKHYNAVNEDENKRHNDEIQRLNKEFGWDKLALEKALEEEDAKHNRKVTANWHEMYRNMSESEAEQLGVWITMLANTEMYGGEISEENKKIVNTILESYNDMPKGTRKAMKNAMEPMLEEMQESEPSLFAKATGIANGILSRLKKSFDIHSPSKETRKIFENVMKGAELGLEDEEDKLNKEIETIAEQIKSDFSSIMPNMGGIKNAVIDKTKTVFTTPNIVFNVQKMDEANLNTAFNYVNRRLGSQY